MQAQAAEARLLAGILKCQSCGSKHGYSLYIYHEAGKLRNGLDLPGKATALILLILLSNLKARVVRKREIYSKEIQRQRKILNDLQC